MTPYIVKKIERLVLTFIFLLTPHFAFSDQIQTQIIADKITVEKDKILYAEGNVRVQHGNKTIKAKSIRFDQISNKIEFLALESFYDDKAIMFSASEALISSDLSEGIIHTANLLLNSTIRIDSDEARLKNGEIYSAKGISRVTSCEECEGKEPNWYITASSAKRDIENSNIVYRNVTVRVKGLPIAYIPYLRMPDPSVDRARGFLVPEAVLTSNLATGLKLPYFIPIGLSSDILITPYFSSKTKTFEYRYRQKFQNGNLNIKGAFSDDDLINDDLRYFSKIVGYFKLGYDIDFNFNAGKVGDNSYLGDYVYSEESDLNSEISLGKTIVENDQFFDGSLTYFREKQQGTSLDEYYSLSGQYVKSISLSSLPGTLRLSADLNSSLNVNDDNSVSRPPSSAQLGTDYNNIKHFGTMQFSTNLFTKLSSFVNSADAGTSNEEFSLQYGALTAITAPRFMKGKNKAIFLSPKISLSYNNQENDILGNYFIGFDELSWGNIHSKKKITSLTESETGLSISVGVEKQVFWETGQRLELSLATSKIGSFTYDPNEISGLTNERLYHLGNFYYRSKLANSVLGSALFSSKGKLLKGDLKSKFFYNKIDFEGNYEFINQTFDSRLSQDLESIDVTSSYNVFDDVQISAGSRYDLTNDQTAKTSFGLGFSFRNWDYNLEQDYLKENREKFSISAVFDDECTRLIFSFENRYQDLGLSKPIKSLMLRLQLKPIANVVFSQGGDQITF